MKPHRIRWLAPALMTVALLATACGGGTATTNNTPSTSGAAPSESGTQTTGSAPEQNFLLLMPTDPSNLDPATNYQIAAEPFLMSVYQRLVAFDPAQNKLVGQLATSWEVSSDGLTYTFHLRSGVKFSDNAPLNADAVKANYDRVVALNQGPAYMIGDYVDHISVVDPMTVQFVLKHPDGSFLSSLASAWGMGIVSPKAVQDHQASEDNGSTWLTGHAVGTGPYMLSDFEPGQSLTLVQNPNYWGGWDGQHLSKIVIKFIPEATTERLQMEQGQADMALGVALSDGKAVASEPNLSVVPINTSTIRVISMNMAKKPLDDINVRLALEYSFPYDDALSVYGGYGSRLYGELPLSVPGSDKSLKYDTDMQKAKDLLTQAGYPNGGLSLDYIWVTGETDARDFGAIWQQQLQTLGIKLNIQEVAPAAYASMTSDTKTAPALIPHLWAPDFPDVLAFLPVLYSSTAFPPQGGNQSRYKNPKVDALLDTIAKETDDQKRLQEIHDVQAQILADAPDIWVSQVPKMAVVNQRVKGYVPDTVYEWDIDFYNMSIGQ